MTGVPCMLSLPVAKRCMTVLGGEEMEGVEELKFLGTVLSQHGEMEEKI